MSTKRHITWEGGRSVVRGMLMLHEARLDVFSGPIDLLLHLITRRRVDIYDVSLSEITDEYLAWLAHAPELDLESATGFCVVAATLMELKSARLLPGRGDDDSASLLEERDFLLARLVECATFREAGAWIRARLSEGEQFHARRPGLEARFVQALPDVLAQVRREDLGAAAARLLGPKPQPELDISHLAPITASVHDAIRTVAARLSADRVSSFRRLCGDGPDRLEVVVRFLAVLELFKSGAIELDQGDRWGDIVLVWTGQAAVDEVLSAAEEYALASGAA